MTFSEEIFDFFSCMDLRNKHEKKSLSGASLREFTDFMNKHDPDLKAGKSGDFAGLQRIGDPEDGTALWTTLTDPKDIEDALKERARYREEEEQRQSEYDKERMMAEERVIDSKETKEGLFEEEAPLTMSNDESLNETRNTERNFINKKDVRDAFPSSNEIDELIAAAKEATNAAKGAASASAPVYTVQCCNENCTIL